MRAAPLAGIALLVLLLAGCAAPAGRDKPLAAAAPTHAAVGVAERAQPLVDGLAADLPGNDGIDASCASSPPEDRVERAGYELLRVAGCTVASDQLLTGAEVRRPHVAFDVQAGVAHLHARLHLLGPEALEARLALANQTMAHGADQGSAQATSRRDSVVEFDLDQPGPGAWELVGTVQETAALRHWVAEIELSWPAS